LSFYLIFCKLRLGRIPELRERWSGTLWDRVTHPRDRQIETLRETASEHGIFRKIPFRTAVGKRIDITKYV
jgi:hypothetical protein